jgi:phosphatidylglycerophosphate synthase
MVGDSPLKEAGMERYEDPERIHTYSYKANNRSLVDRFILNHWYNLAFRIIPKRMSANLVSMLGNLGSWFTFLIVSGFLFGPAEEFSRDRPWVFALAALGLCFYQTFDAMDGMQARRLGTSGPLGEFIDHWFDSLNVFLVPFGIFLAFPVVPSYLLVLLVLLTTLTDWIELRRVKETNTLNFDYLSSEEATFGIILFYLSNWILGYGFWARPLPGLGMPIIEVIIIIGILGLVTTGTLSMALYRFSWLPEVVAELLELLPLALGVFVLQSAQGRLWLVLGGLCLGFSGSRIVSNLLRNRLLGLATRRWYPDVLVLDALFLFSLFMPGLPSWAPRLTLLAYMAWNIAMLAVQFRHTLGRVKEKLGIGLFSLPPAAAGSPAQAGKVS